MALKKQWYEIISPKMFGEAVVAETVAADPKNLIGRKVQFSMLELAKDYTNFYVKADFQVDRVEGSKAYTKFVGHDIMRERIYRMIQRRFRRVDCIEDVTTKDGVRVRVKIVYTLIKRVNTSIKGATRSKCRELIHTAAGSMDFEEFAKMMITGRLSASIRKELIKIY